MTGLGYEADLSDPEKLKDIGLRTAYASAMARAFQLSTILTIFAGLLVVAGGIFGRFRKQPNQFKSDTVPPLGIKK